MLALTCKNDLFKLYETMDEALLKDFFPKPNLIAFVQKYQVYRFCFSKDILPPPKFFTPRPEQSITFYLRDFQKSSFLNENKVTTYPRCVINGIYTEPIYRYGGQDFFAIKIVLHPSALYRFQGIAMQTLTNGFLNAEDIWGNNIKLVCDQLENSKNLTEKLMIIETFIESLTSKNKKTLHPLDKVSQFMIVNGGNKSLDWLADQSCLSVRQFIRNFQERIGVSPKMFSRIIRFNNAFLLRNNAPSLAWSQIAIECGYHDYQHLSKEFKAFTTHLPTNFYEIEKKAPERTFGLLEL